MSRKEIDKKREDICASIIKDFDNSFSISDNAPLSGDASIRVHGAAEGRRLNVKDLYKLMSTLNEFNKLTQLESLLDEFFPEPQEVEK